MDPAWYAALEARAADIPFARLHMCVTQARIDNLCLRAAFTLWMMPQCTVGAMPCDWCGLPTGSWCEVCPPPVTMGEQENAQNSRRVCTICDRRFSRCRRCFAWRGVHPRNRQPARPMTEAPADPYMGTPGAPPARAPVEWAQWRPGGPAMEQLPHFLQGPLHGQEIPLVGTHLILAARAAPANPDDGLDSVEMGFRWWDTHLERWARFTAITYGGPLPAPRPIQAPEVQTNRGHRGPPVPYYYEHPHPYTGPGELGDPNVSSDGALSSGEEPTDFESDALGRFPPDGNYSGSDSE